MNNKSGIGVGAVSILMIFVVLCLTTISVLTFNSSSASLKIAENARSFAVAKSSATYNANLKLAEIDSILYNAYETPFSFDEAISQLSQLDDVVLSNQADGYVLSFSEKINTNSSLNIKISIPFKAQDESFELIQWVVTGSSHEYNTGGQNIWDGK